MLLRRWELALHQRRVYQRRQERQQQVDELAHQERRQWVKRARFNQRPHNDATHLGLRARSERLQQ